MRTEQQMATIVTRRMKELHQEVASKWSVPVSVITHSTFGLAVTMMYESGYSADQIADMARQLIDDLAASAAHRSTT
jgi:hypothetical protein